MKVSTYISLLAAKPLVNPAQTTHHSKLITHSGTKFREISTFTHRTRRAKLSYITHLMRADHIPVLGSNKGFLEVKESTLRQHIGGVLSEGLSQDTANEDKIDGVISRLGAQYRNDTIEEVGEPKVGGAGRPLVVGFDAEWYVPHDADTRRILSMQFAFRSPLDGQMYVWLLDLSRYGVRVAESTVLQWFLSDTAALTGFEYLVRPKNSAKNKKNDPAFHLVLVAHYGIVDWSAFYRGNTLMREADSIRRTLSSVKAPIVRRIRSDDMNRQRRVVLHVRDTMHLAPAGSSLAVLGDALRYPKIELPDGYDKANMQKLMRERPDVFWAYAATDSVIEVLWVEGMTGDNCKVPNTLGGQAAKMLRENICTVRGWTVKDFDFHFRGLDRVVSGVGKEREVSLVPRDEAADVLTKASNAYYGGRNECFMFGIHESEKGWHDFDLSGAYATAMCLIPDPDYDVQPMGFSGRLHKGMIHPFMWLFGFIQFRFPENTMYPCLPIKDKQGRGLVYVMEGKTWASAPEIWLALELGAEIELLQPTLAVPTRDTHSLADGVKGLVEARAAAKKAFGKGSPQELAAKERANSAYGKLAQGLADKRAYSTREDKVQSIPPSTVTSAPFATLTTGFVRAIISAALVQLHALGYKVASVTTDGFLTDAPESVIKELDLFGLRQHFSGARKWLNQEEDIWELKHAAKTLVMSKTRGGFGIGEINGNKLPHAGAGFKASGGVLERIEKLGKAPALGEVFLQRQGKIPCTFHALPSPSQYVRKGADGIGRDEYREISWEYDYKRKVDDSSITTGTVEIDGTSYEHVSYETLPWETMENFDNARCAVDGQTSAIKTEEQVGTIQRRIARRRSAVAAGIHTKGGQARSEAISVLRGLRAGILLAPWFNKESMSGREICDKIGEVFGVALGANDWKNAGRETRKNKVAYDGMEDKLQELSIAIKVVKRA